MSVPNWYEIVLLSLAAWRTFQLLAADSITEPLRRYVTRLGTKWEKEGDALPKEYREKWALFIGCPYCLGAWIGIVWWVAWEIFPTETLIATVPFVISAGVVAGDKLLGMEEE